MVNAWIGMQPCVDTTASSYLNITSKNPGGAANQACSRKENLYEEIIVNHLFLPFTVETLGSFSDSAKIVVQKLGLLLNAKSGNVQAKSFFIQKINFAIERGNMAAMLGFIPLTAIFFLFKYLNYRVIRTDEATLLLIVLLCFLFLPHSIFKSKLNSRIKID